MNNSSQATPEDLRRQRIKCFSPYCKYRAYLIDWSGWKWCIRHWYWNLKYASKDKWFYFKTTKIFI